MRYFQPDFNNDKRKNNKRRELQDWLKKNLNENSAIDMLEQVFKQHKDIKLVKMCAKALGLTLRRFLTSDILELYFNIYRKKESV